MRNAAITFISLGSAFDDDPRGRAISHPLSSLLVEGCPCGADLSSAFGAPLLQGATLLACKNGICEKNQYSLKYENTASLTFLFIPPWKPTSAPSGHLLPKEGGRMPPTATFPAWRERRQESTPFFLPSSFRANARNLFRSRSGKMGGQRKTGSTVFLKTCNHGVSRKLIHAGNRKRQTKKIPRLRSG